MLSKLDDEMVAEDELDTEVEQADIIKDLCVTDIELALERASSRKVANATSADRDSSRMTPMTKVYILKGPLPRLLILNN